MLRRLRTAVAVLCCALAIATLALVLSAPTNASRPNATTTNAVGLTAPRGIATGAVLFRSVGVYAAKPAATRANPTENSSTRGGGQLPFGLSRLRIDISGNPVVVWLAVITIGLVSLAVLVNVLVVLRAVWVVTIGRFVRRRQQAG